MTAVESHLVNKVERKLIDAFGGLAYLCEQDQDQPIQSMEAATGTSALAAPSG